MSIRKRPFGFAKVFSWFLACAQLSLFVLLAQAARTPTQGQLLFLVARREILDPFFERSVVLMLPRTDFPLVVGLIVNKPARVPLGKIFPQSPRLKTQTARAFFGGPVDVHVPSLIFRTSEAPRHALRLYDDVYLTFDSRLIVAQLEKRKPSSKLRLFLGRAQWAPGQLENEMDHGAWYSERKPGNLIFSLAPQQLWQTLHDRLSPGHYIRYVIPQQTRPPCHASFPVSSPL